MPLITCHTCRELPAVPGWIECGRCADRRSHSSEAEVRIGADAYEKTRQRMLNIGCASFIPRTDHERRLHKAARAKLLATMDPRR